MFDGFNVRFGPDKDAKLVYSYVPIFQISTHNLRFVAPHTKKKSSTVSASVMRPSEDRQKCFSNLLNPTGL